MTSCAERGYHDFTERLGFFKNTLTCKECGYQTSDLGTGVAATILVGALLIGPVVSGIFLGPHHHDPMDG